MWVLLENCATEMVHIFDLKAKRESNADVHSTLVQTNYMLILVKVSSKMAIYRQNRA